MVAAHKDAARPRRPRAAAPPPLTEAQLDEVRRAVLAMSGTGARSVSKHGIVVYLDKELPLPQPRPAAECLRRRRARRMPRRRGPTACLARRGSAEAGAASRSAWSGEKLHTQVQERMQTSDHLISVIDTGKKGFVVAKLSLAAYKPSTTVPQRVTWWV